MAITTDGFVQGIRGRTRPRLTRALLATFTLPIALWLPRNNFSQAHPSRLSVYASRVVNIGPIALLLLPILLLSQTAKAQTAQASAAPERRTTTVLYTPLLLNKQNMAGYPLVPVRGLGKDQSGTFLLDTGTGFVAVTESMAARLKLVSKPVMKNGKPFLVDGRPQAKVTLPVLLVGQLPIADEAVVLKDQEISGALGTTETKVDGILGMSILQALAVLFDFSKHEVTLWYPGSLTDADVHRLGFMDAAIPLVVTEDGAFTTPIQVQDGAYHGQDNFVIDTGWTAPLG